jgi:hypothetical protein
MATLSNPNFQVDILTGISTVVVTGTVDVELTPFETFLVNAGLPLQLHSDLWGNDGGNGIDDDHLFPFTAQSITAPGTYTFRATIPSGYLNEDSSWNDDRDEVYNIFRMVSGSNLFPIGNIVARSPEIRGYF